MKRCAAILILGTYIIFPKPASIDGERAPSIPFISGDGFRSIADHVFDTTDDSLHPDEISYADIIFVKTDKLGQFFHEIHPYIHTKYILITHNSDNGAPGTYKDFLENDNILHWYGQNPTIDRHEKFSAIPIGIANRYVGDTGNVQNFLKHYAYIAINSIKKDYVLGINFMVDTYIERETVHDIFFQKKYCHAIFTPDHYTYLTKMSQARYILSPRGHGLDCHRTWEALIVGAIPVVRTSELDELFADLPILIVKDWHDISKKLLKERFHDLQKRFDSSAMQKLTYVYWKERLHSFREQCRLDRK